MYPSNQTYSYRAQPHQIHFTYRRMHKYAGQTYCLPLELNLQLQSPTTPNTFHIENNAHICRADVPPANQT